MTVPLLVFSVTLGLGIIAMIILSAISNLPYSVPTIPLIGTIMVLGTGMSYLCLKTKKADER